MCFDSKSITSPGFMLRASTTFRDRFLYYRGYQYANFILFFNQKINKIKKINLLKKSKFDRFLFYLASFRTLKIVLFIAHIMVSVLDNKEKTCYWWFHMVNIYQFCGVIFLIWIKYSCNIQLEWVIFICPVSESWR